MEPEPIFFLAGAFFFKAALAASFWQAKKESLFVVSGDKTFTNVNKIWSLTLD